MTTPRDAIGLSDRLREDFLRGEITVWNTLPEAATHLDALTARVKELEAEQAAIVRDYQRVNGQLADEMNRALRAEQERDEAYERAAKHFEESEHLVWSNDEAADAIRRLAGRVKGGNDET